jgi:hypothetical protein
MKRENILNLTTKVMVLLWMIVVLAVTMSIYDALAGEFAFWSLSFLQFVRYTLLGALVALYSTKIFEKGTFGFEINVVNLVFVGIFFIISITYILEINDRLILGFITRWISGLNLFSDLSLRGFQFMFGYSLMHLFIRN